MSYAKASNIITLTYTLDDLFEKASRETHAIAKNKFGENGPMVEQVAMSSDERFFFDDYLENAKDEILGLLDKMTFGISDPVALDTSSLIFKIKDKSNYNESILVKFDREIEKAIVDSCIYEWLLKVEQFDLAKMYGVRFEAGKVILTNLSVELRKPILS